MYFLLAVAQKVSRKNRISKSKLVLDLHVESLPLIVPSTPYGFIGLFDWPVVGWDINSWSRSYDYYWSYDICTYILTANELIVPVAYVSPKPSSTISRSALVLISLSWLLSEPSGITKTFLLCLQIATPTYQLVQTVIVSKRVNMSCVPRRKGEKTKICQHVLLVRQSVFLVSMGAPRKM